MKYILACLCSIVGISLIAYGSKVTTRRSIAGKTLGRYSRIQLIQGEPAKRIGYGIIFDGIAMLFAIIPILTWSGSDLLILPAAIFLVIGMIQTTIGCRMLLQAKTESES